MNIKKLSVFVILSGLLSSTANAKSLEELYSEVVSAPHLYRFEATQYHMRDFRWPFQSLYGKEVKSHLKRPKTSCRIVQGKQCERLLLFMARHHITKEACEAELLRWKADFAWNIENEATVFTECKKVDNPFKHLQDEYSIKEL